MAVVNYREVESKCEYKTVFCAKGMIEQFKNNGVLFKCVSTTVCISVIFAPCFQKEHSSIARSYT
jgi:hypothetical protein